MKMGMFLATAAMLAAGPASANLLANGSFETPVLSSLSTNFAYYTNGSTAITGWTVDMRPGSTSNWVQPTNNSGFGGLNSSDGIQWLDLTGITGRGAGVRANAVATDASFDYTLSFDVGGVFFNGSYGTATVDLLINGTLVGSYSAAPPASNAINWERYSYGFAGTGSPVTVGLYASFSPTSSEYGVALDHVVLEGALRPVSAVPEPQSWLLLIGGFGLIGALSRRRRLDFVRVTA